jgi:hypothetical protein
MTRDEILNMPAGREMDVTIGYHVMDLVAPPGVYPEYSTDIAAAWEVVEKISEQKNAQVYICTNFSSEFGDTFYVEIYKNWDGEQEQILTSATAETAPLAICRGALLAVIEALL